MEILLIWAFTIAVSASLFAPAPVVSSREIERSTLAVEKK